MRVAIISTFTHPSRQRHTARSVMQSAVPYLIAALCPPDVEVEVYNEKETDIPLNRDWDLVFFSYLHAYYEHTKILSTLLRLRGIKTVAGGRHAGHFRQDVLKHFDAVVIGEPESNIPAVLEDFRKGRLQPIYEKPAAAIDQIPPYRYDLMDYRKNPFTLPTIEASRGCPFACNFCVLTGWEKYRYRPIEHVLRDIEKHMIFNRRFFGLYDRVFQFVDNNLGGSPDYLRALCEALLPMKVYWGCALTYNILMDHELVKLMGRAGCRYIYTGLESLSPESLRSMRKGHNTLKETRTVLRRTYEAGILLSFGLLVGSDGDTESYLQRLPEYLDDLGTYTITFLGIVCPYPETPFFRTVAEDGRLFPGLISRDFDGYTLCHCPKNLDPEAAVHHFKRLCGLLKSPLRTMRQTLHQLGLSDLPRYNHIILAASREAASVGQALSNPARTFLGGKDELEAWDLQKMAELGLKPQLIGPEAAAQLRPIVRRGASVI